MQFGTITVSLIDGRECICTMSQYTRALEVCIMVAEDKGLRISDDFRLIMTYKNQARIVDNDEVISDIFKAKSASTTMGKGMISGFFAKVKAKIQGVAKVPMFYCRKIIYYTPDIEVDYYQQGRSRKMAGLVTKVVVLLQVRLDYGHGEPAPAPGEFLDIAGDLPEGFSVVIRVIQIFDTAKTGLLELRRAML